jgi:hypothetical protein
MLRLRSPSLLSPLSCGRGGAKRSHPTPGARLRLVYCSWALEAPDGDRATEAQVTATETRYRDQARGRV